MLSDTCISTTLSVFCLFHLPGENRSGTSDLPRFPTIWRKSINKSNTTGKRRKITLLKSQNDFPQCLNLKWCFDYCQSWHCFEGDWCCGEHPAWKPHFRNMSTPVGLIPLSQLLSARNCAVSKQEKLFSLASLKGDNMNSLNVLKALNDSKVTNDELHLIKITKWFNTDLSKKKQRCLNNPSLNSLNLKRSGKKFATKFENNCNLKKITYQLAS